MKVLYSASNKILIFLLVASTWSLHSASSYSLDVLDFPRSCDAAVGDSSAIQGFYRASIASIASIHGAYGAGVGELFAVSELIQKYSQVDTTGFSGEPLAQHLKKQLCLFYEIHSSQDDVGKLLSNNVELSKHLRKIAKNLYRDSRTLYKDAQEMKKKRKKELKIAASRLNKILSAERKGRQKVADLTRKNH